ncbi:polyisoprenoid diphosphate/phosphate phosphohydrolase PLPP6-like [Amphiura filiformis]|uniref:polyisoprenoid diphosphate/phosphate phosphohydrolase PLPP6-like n=1 Tax=Amphiura filiformis TaxID=82378 RepID=UPI003B20E687
MGVPCPTVLGTTDLYINAPRLSSIFFVCASPNSRWGWCRPLIKIIEIFGDGLVWMLVPVAFLIVTEEKWLIEFCVNILAATAFDLCVLFLLKMLASRPRPVANKGDMLIVVAVDNYSFPSGHCTRAGMMTYIIIEYFNLTGGYIALGGVWVVVMAISRLMLGRHYITDVICGTVVGFMEGAVVIAVWITVDNLESILSLFLRT